MRGLQMLNSILSLVRDMLILIYSTALCRSLLAPAAFRKFTCVLTLWRHLFFSLPVVKPKLNRIDAVEECDATMFNSCNQMGKIKISK